MLRGLQVCHTGFHLRGVSAHSGNAYFGPSAAYIYSGEDFGNVDCNGNTFASYGNGYWHDDYFGVRPVISLETRVLEEDVPKIPEQTNPSWGGPGNIV